MEWHEENLQITDNGLLSVRVYFVVLRPLYWMRMNSLFIWRVCEIVHFLGNQINKYKASWMEDGK